MIQLVSDQTMQNLLPVMAWKPDCIVQVRSRHARYREVADHFKSAVACLQKVPVYARFAPQFMDWPINQMSPTIGAALASCRQIFSQYSDTVANISGGTKQMSIALFQAAQEAGAKTVYCDTGRHRFVLNDGPGVESEQVRGLDSVARDLTVDILMAAHGKNLPDWQSAEPLPSLISFGHSLYPLKRDADDGFISYERKLRHYFRCHRGRIPSSRKRQNELLSKPLPEPSGSDAAKLLDLAREAGLLRKDDAGWFPVVNGTSTKTVRHELERISNLLEGSWLELQVVHCLQQSTRFADIHWSVEPLEPATSAYGETDIICVDLERCGLHVISCKQGSPKLEHIEGLAERREHLGGRFARASVATLRVPDHQEKKIRQWGDLHGVDILIGDEIAELLAAPLKQEGE